MLVAELGAVPTVAREPAREVVEQQTAFRFRPTIMECEDCQRFLRDVAQRFTTQRHQSTPESLLTLREAAFRDAGDQLGAHAQAGRALISLLCDLLMQDWQLELSEDICLVSPSRAEDRSAERDRVRNGLAIARNEQLCQSSVMQFLRSVSAPRLFAGKWHSIHSLIRDGRELAGRIEPLLEESDPEQVVRELRQIIRPYLQFVTEGARCEWTGLRLSEIWRYFRYTWLTPARTVPGRTMLVLIRDAAQEPHPVIGIAALQSSIIGQRERDEWIGWDQDTALQQIQTNPSCQTAGWLLSSLDALVADILRSDLVEEGIVSEREIICPTEQAIARLRAVAVSERSQHQLELRKQTYKQRQAADDWPALARTHLYRSKRALALSGLLQVRLRFQEAGFTSPCSSLLTNALRSAPFRDAVRRLVRHLKATRVGINMMDIGVCGAVHPYRALLGGKLISLLVTSPEIVVEYRGRYGASASVIASAMRGVPVVRRPELSLLCTAGLFGDGSSQYSRVRMPAREAGGCEGEIRYEPLSGVTSYSTFHISQETLEQMHLYLEQQHGGSNVHGIFGEGVNPKMRKIREALALLGLPDDLLLQAGSPRRIYMVSLARNFADVLLGKTVKPDYYLPLDRPSETTEKIADFWRRRWLAGRICHPGVINTVRAHTLAYPMRHGAVVEVPPTPADAGLDLYLPGDIRDQEDGRIDVQE